MKLIFSAHAICRCESESFTVRLEVKIITKTKFHNRVTSTSWIELHINRVSRKKKSIWRKSPTSCSENKIVHSNHFSVNNSLACMQQVLLLVLCSSNFNFHSHYFHLLCVCMYASKLRFIKGQLVAINFFLLFFTLCFFLPPLSLTHFFFVFAFTQFQYVHNQQKQQQQQHTG